MGLKVSNGKRIAKLSEQDFVGVLKAQIPQKYTFCRLVFRVSFFFEAERKRAPVFLRGYWGT